MDQTTRKERSFSTFSEIHIGIQLAFGLNIKFFLFVMTVSRTEQRMITGEV